MKYLAVVFAALLSIAVSYHFINKKARDKNFIADRYSAEYGCLVGTQFGCFKIKDDIKRGECFDHSMSFCENVAVNFEKFLRRR